MRLVISLIALAPLAVAAQTADQLRYVCKDFVERSLPDPREAELAEVWQAQPSRRKDGLYVVRFRGRVKNQYNALTFATLECVIRHGPGADDFSAVSVRAR